MAARKVGWLTYVFSTYKAKDFKLPETQIQHLKPFIEASRPISVKSSQAV